MEYIIKIIKLVFAIQLLNSACNNLINTQNIVEIKKEPIVIEQPIMVLEIPKIKFKGNIYQVNSNLNNIDKNIIIMKDSDMPDEDNSILIIGGHSGYGRYAYFNKLKELKENDKIALTYKNKKYNYKIINYYLDSKDGSINISNFKDKNIIILYTCYTDKKNYLVYVGERV